MHCVIYDAMRLEQVRWLVHPPYMSPPSLRQVLQRTVSLYLANGGPLLGAAVAFYAILSIGPLLLVVLATVQWAVGDLAAGHNLAADLSLVVQPQAAAWVGRLVEQLQQSQGATSTGLFSSLILLWSGTRLFAQVQTALHQLWQVRIDPQTVGRNIVETLRAQFLAVSMVFLLGALLVTSLLLSSLAAVLKGALGPALAGSEMLWSTTTFGLSMATLSGLFALLYRVLPRATVDWRDAATGAALTAACFTASEVPLSYYLGTQGVPSFFGAAGSFVMFLLWVYYAAQIFFLGAQFTLVWAHAHGRHIRLPAQASLGPAPSAELTAMEPLRVATAATSPAVLPVHLGAAAGRRANVAAPQPRPTQ